MADFMPALVGEFGNERDVGAISILSLNDGLLYGDDCWARQGMANVMALVADAGLRWLSA